MSAGAGTFVLDHFLNVLFVAHAILRSSTSYSLISVALCGSLVGGLVRSKIAWIKHNEWKDTPLRSPVLKY